MKARIPEENLPKEEVISEKPELLKKDFLMKPKKENLYEKNGTTISAKPESEELPILISVEDDGSETFLIQTKDYKFAQFLAMIQNRCTLGIINRILEEGLSGEADQKSINNLIHFCDLLYLWSKKAVDIDDDILKTLKGEPENESDSN